VDDAVGAAQVGAERRLTVGSCGDEVEPSTCAEMLAQKRATTSRPSYSKGIGGIDMKTSSVRRATSASRSADSHARRNLATIASSEGEPETAAVRGTRPWALGVAGRRAPA
jgi:hypothetical protein